VRFEHEVGKRPNISIEVVEINGELDGTVENVLIKKVPPPQAKPHLRMRIQGPEKRWFRQRCFWHLDRIIPVHDTGSIVDRLASGWIDDTGVGPVEFTAED
jgi:hypothetical protein